MVWWFYRSGKRRQRQLENAEYEKMMRSYDSRHKHHEPIEKNPASHDESIQSSMLQSSLLPHASVLSRASREPSQDSYSAYVRPATPPKPRRSPGGPTSDAVDKFMQPSAFRAWHRHGEAATMQGSVLGARLTDFETPTPASTHMTRSTAPPNQIPAGSFNTSTVTTSSSTILRSPVSSSVTPIPMAPSASLSHVNRRGPPTPSAFSVAFSLHPGRHRTVGFKSKAASVIE